MIHHARVRQWYAVLGAASGQRQSADLARLIHYTKTKLVRFHQAGARHKLSRYS
ncbi:unnamed protein product [Ixodes persulcatus]